MYWFHKLGYYFDDEVFTVYQAVYRVTQNPIISADVFFMEPGTLRQVQIQGFTLEAGRTLTADDLKGILKDYGMEDFLQGVG